jgi:hypothetical protein
MTPAPGGIGALKRMRADQDSDRRGERARDEKTPV